MEPGVIAVPPQLSFWKRLLAFSGPAYLVSVGYMDPGNWATDIAAGSKFGYALLWVLVMSNLMALLLQSLSARLGIVTRMDLAQACRALYGKKAGLALWVLAEIAIVACDLAEVLGSAIGLQLLFGLPLIAGILITALDTFLLLLLHGRGVRLLEAFIVVLVTTIGVCLALEVFLAKPGLAEVAAGLVPSLPGEGALYLAMGMLGATVMPHNIYLHSALVQSRRVAPTPAGIRSGIRFNTIDSFVALNGALFVNASLLVMAAAAFHKAGFHRVEDILEAHRLLEPILGEAIAPVAFAVALLLSGQSSTITGTLAGQIVMEGFLQLRLRPIVRRMLTRAVAIVPAVAVIATMGEKATGELLVLSQVILSLQLPFAVIPLVHLVSDGRWLGQYAIGRRLKVLAWLVAGLITGLNALLAYQEISGWLAAAGSWAWLLWVTVVPAAVGLVVFLGFVIIGPLWQRMKGLPLPEIASVHGPASMPALAPPRPPQRIAAAVDFSPADTAVLSYAVALARASGRGAQVLLFHVVESGGVRILGGEMDDREVRSDTERLELYRTELAEQGVEAVYELGFGEPAVQLARLAETHGAELMVVGSHGHVGMADLVHGTTVNHLRHLLKIPVLVVPAGS
ncbi:Nramp family divalent metal transporter [Thermoanaerobaculum aquaticum]|uniref:Nramp family divalent metal transporter n=1 Tax=Thermoanaerobaculum aquaticum TaxID=1312852 RepID=UPI0006A6D168